MTAADISALPELLEKIAEMDRSDCAEALATAPGITVPPHLRAESLRRIFAYKVQARTLGGLTTQERRTLRTFVNGKARGAASVSILSPGAHLVRVWNGLTYRVQVTKSGYLLDSKTYASLSAVVRRITGTA